MSRRAETPGISLARLTSTPISLPAISLSSSIASLLRSGASRFAQAPRFLLSEWLTGDDARLAPAEQPAHDHRDQRQADQDPQQAGHRDAAQLRKLVQLVGPAEADRREITSGRSDDGPGQRERAGGGRGEGAAGRAARPGGGQRAQVAGGLAADQADAHREDA